MSKRIAFSLITAVLLSACAGVEITRVDKSNPNPQGIRFYRPMPYLLVTKELTGSAGSTGEKLECKVIYLPNLNEDYAYEVRAGIGSVDAKITLEDGWRLTAFGETRDTKAPEMIAALTGLLKEAGGGKTLTAQPAWKAGLYAFVYDQNTGLITGVKLVASFE